MMKVKKEIITIKNGEMPTNCKLGNKKN